MKEQQEPLHTPRPVLAAPFTTRNHSMKRKKSVDINTFGTVLTVEEAAQVLGLSRSLTYDMARDGALPVLRCGRRMVVPKVALQRWLERAEAVTTQRAG